MPPGGRHRAAAGSATRGAGCDDAGASLPTGPLAGDRRRSPGRKNEPAPVKNHTLVGCPGSVPPATLGPLPRRGAGRSNQEASPARGGLPGRVFSERTPSHDPPHPPRRLLPRLRGPPHGARHALPPVPVRLRAARPAGRGRDASTGRRAAAPGNGHASGRCARRRPEKLRRGPRRRPSGRVRHRPASACRAESRAERPRIRRRLNRRPPAGGPRLGGPVGRRARRVRLRDACPVVRPGEPVRAGAGAGLPRRALLHPGRRVRRPARHAEHERDVRGRRVAPAPRPCVPTPANGKCAQGSTARGAPVGGRRSGTVRGSRTRLRHHHAWVVIAEAPPSPTVVVSRRPTYLRERPRRLTSNDRDAICRLAEVCPLREIAALFGVSQQTIAKVINASTRVSLGVGKASPAWRASKVAWTFPMVGLSLSS